MREIVDKMDEQVKNLLRSNFEPPGVQPVHVYKKLDLVGHPDNRATYFESISEDKFNKTLDKHLLNLESIVLSAPKNNYLKGIEVKDMNGTS